MKNLIILLFFFAFTDIGIAQNHAICTYKVSENNRNNNIGSDIAAKDAQKLINEGIEIAKTFKYILKFNNNESIFYLENSMKSDAKSPYSHSIAKALVGRGIHYQNKEANENIHQLEISGGKFLITDCFFGDWEITKDTKNIGKYECFKAIQKCTDCTSVEEVWFTPEIPMPYGPLGYSGLPGLILEIKKKVLTLRVLSINFNETDLAIDKPTKGKIVTKDEFKKLTDDIRARAKH